MNWSMHEQVQAFAARLSPPAELRLLAGVGHFFHGHLHELQSSSRELYRAAGSRREAR